MDNNNQTLDLISEVTKMLQEANHPHPEEWKRFLDPVVYQNPNVMAQRFYINRAWRLIIGTVTTEPTMDQRYCLIENGTIEDWLRIFKTGLVKWITSRQLPTIQN